MIPWARARWVALPFLRRFRYAPRVRLAWKLDGRKWVARSAEGSTVRLYPHEDQKHVFVMEAALGGTTYWRGADASRVILSSRSPSKTTEHVLDSLKRQLEGYALRYDTTGIRDPKAANDTIKAMNPDEWARRLSDWYAKNVANDNRAPLPVATEERFVHLGFQIDTNRINARGRLEHMNRLERWAADDVIEVIMSETAATEAARAGSRQARKAMSYVQSVTLATNEHERVMMRKIELAIFPGGAKSSGDRNDVEIVFNALKYSRRLVTTDGGSKRQPGGILGAREKLAAIGVTVMTDEEACAYVKGLIAARDERARQEARETGARLPRWVGRD